MVEIRPLEHLNATVRIPGSKSYTQRAMVIAALAEGESRLRDILIAEDTDLLAVALGALGANIRRDGRDMIVAGTGGKIAPPSREIHLGNNGTAMRLLAGMASLGKGRTILTGDGRLCERPMKPLLDALRDLGALSQTDGGLGFPPVTILGGGIRGGKTVLRDIESSQYVSSLLIAAPFAAGDVTLVLEGKIPSLPYVALTIETMGEFGVRVIEEGPGRYVVPGGQRYRAREYRIEGDVSSASYFFAAALLKGRIRVENINPQTRQGDIRFLDILERLGCPGPKGRRPDLRGGGRDDPGGDDLRHGRHARHGADAGGAFGHAARQDIDPECRPSAPEGERPPGRPVERAGKDRDRGEGAGGRPGHHRGEPARVPDPNLQRSPDRHGLRRPGTGRPGDEDRGRGMRRKILPWFLGSLGRTLSKRPRPVGRRGDGDTDTDFSADG